jgi:uncharacterized lipoprotein YmbA
MKAIILARVSTKEQEEGHSIAAQRQRLIDYSARKGLTVIRTFELVESSTRGERKDFAAMLEFAKAQSEIVAIVADAVDRFQRSFKESVLIDELICKEQIELHFYREGMIIGNGATSTDIMRWDFSIMGAKSYVLNLSENVGVAMLGLAACNLAGRPATEYVLGTITSAKEVRVPQTGLPIVEIKRVQLPDYLDTTEILERSGNRLIPSPTARWGERMSVGMSQALSASLAARLPRMFVTASPTIEHPVRNVFVDVAAFETRGRQVILVTHWVVTNGATRQTLVAQQTTLVETIAGTDDGAVVAAMSDAVEGLADQIAAGIEGFKPAGVVEAEAAREAR